MNFVAIYELNISFDVDICLDDIVVSNKFVFLGE